MRPDYWIIFKSSKLFHQFFLKDGFGHCFIICKDDYNWIMINPGIDRFEIKILDYHPDYDLPADFSKHPDSKVVMIRISPENRSKFHTKGLINLPFINCVNMVKYVIGISISGITPYGLYKAIKKLEKRKKRHKAILSIKIIEHKIEN